jgi:ankyrin repeat protein
MPRLFTVVVFSAAALSLGAAPVDDLFKSIRQNDIAAIRQAIASKTAVNQADSRGTTPLHYAAVLGSVEAMKLLLDAGADVNARNASDATPLILAAPSAAKVTLLLAKGADTKAQTKAGRTALIVAAGCRNCLESVRLLVDAGSELEHQEERGATALAVSTDSADTIIARFLVSRGAKPVVADKARFTPLMGVVAAGDIALTKELISKGADVNTANVFGGKVRHGNIALTGLTPLILAAPHGSAEMVKTLIAAGAKVNVKDGRGMTPLMAAVASENQDLSVIKALIAAGADVNAVDVDGVSVLDWAGRFGHPPTLKALQAAGAKGKPPVPAPVRSDGKAPLSALAAVELAMPLLHSSSTEFFKQTGCVGCHHQPATDRARQVAKRSGISVAGAGTEESLRSMSVTRPFEPGLLQLIGPGGGVDSIGNLALGFHAAEVPANSLTDAMVHYISANQQADGSWLARGIARVPMEDSNITRTAIAVRILSVYGWPGRQAEFDDRIARARTWLLKAEPRTTYEKADRLLGLVWSRAGSTEIARAAAGLRRDQRPEGGWAQNKYLAPDAYATGLALYALNQADQLRASDPEYRKGVDFLLKTQLDDGSWYVRSRSPKFQPYFQSGFPHGHDQWISATATAYAVMALSPAAEQAVRAAR